MDIEKLLLAHELATKWNEDALISVQFWSNDIERYDYRLELHGITEYLSGDIDNLISELERITKPEPKYIVGDEVWWLDGRTALASGVITEPQFNSRSNSYQYLTDNRWCVRDEELYPSRRLLIQAQIDYWKKLDCADGRHDWVENHNTGLNICVVCDERAQSIPLTKTVIDRLDKDHRFASLQPPFEGDVVGFKCNHKEIMTNKPYPRSNPPSKCDDCGELYR